MSWGDERDLALEAACLEASRVLGIRAKVWSESNHEFPSPDYLPATFPDFAVGLVGIDEFETVAPEEAQSLEKNHQCSGLVRVSPLFRRFDREVYTGLFTMLDWLGPMTEIPEWYRYGCRIHAYRPFRKE